MPRNWLDENGLEPGDIKMVKWVDGEWQTLDTEVVSEDGTVDYEATAQGLSIYAVTGVKEEVTPTPTPTPTETPSPGFTLLLAMAGLAAAAYAATRRR